MKSDKDYSDEELLDIIRRRTAELGRLPTRNDIEECHLIHKRFGPWPRALEAAGVKPVGERYKRHMDKKRHRKRARRKCGRGNAG